MSQQRVVYGPFPSREDAEAYIERYRSNEQDARGRDALAVVGVPA